MCERCYTIGYRWVDSGKGVPDGEAKDELVRSGDIHGDDSFVRGVSDRKSEKDMTRKFYTQMMAAGAWERTPARFRGRRR